MRQTGGNIRFHYDIRKYTFANFIKSYLNTDSLEELHLQHKFNAILTDSKGETPDQGQKLHRLFYDSMDIDEHFKCLYDDFIENIIKPHFEDPIAYQKYPTFRIHQPGNISVFAWHKDRDFGHSPCERNIYLPITDAYETNTIWAESRDGLQDFAPMTCNKNEYIIWDGANCSHGNKINETNQTRVSFDFRVIKLKDLASLNVAASKTCEKKFCLGGYYDEKVI
jgi:hypothetical protein